MGQGACGPVQRPERALTWPRPPPHAALVLASLAPITPAHSAPAGLNRPAGAKPNIRAARTAPQPLPCFLAGSRASSAPPCLYPLPRVHVVADRWPEGSSRRIPPHHIAASTWQATPSLLAKQGLMSAALSAVCRHRHGGDLIGIAGRSGHQPGASDHSPKSRE